MLAREAHIDQALIGTVIAGQARFERNAGTLVLIAGRVEGNVRTLLDWRGALALGAAIGVARGRCSAAASRHGRASPEAFGYTPAATHQRCQEPMPP